MFPGNNSVSNVICKNFPPCGNSWMKILQVETPHKYNLGSSNLHFDRIFCDDGDEEYDI